MPLSTAPRCQPRRAPDARDLLAFGMRLAVLFALAACGGPIQPPRIRQTASTARPGPAIQRPPDAPPDPLGTHRPGDRSCTTDGDCKSGDRCFAPDAPPPGTPPPACTTDPQCPAGQVCAALACVAACTADSCAPGQECRSGHCAPLACTGTDPRSPSCPQNHRCNPTSGACDRQTCTSRSQCDAGVCFQGHCFSHDAYCMPQP
jgi:Cys-rich repeat protein